jgi:hypothetical protein
MIPCTDCIETWAAYDEIPPCGGTMDLSACDQITEPLHADNAAAWAVYDLVRDQHVAGMSGPVGVSLPAMTAACDLLGIPADERLPIVYRVRSAWHAAIYAALRAGKRQRG